MLANNTVIVRNNLNPMVGSIILYVNDTAYPSPPRPPSVLSFLEPGRQGIIWREVEYLGSVASRIEKNMSISYVFNGSSYTVRGGFRGGIIS
ncbi:MAG: hypothetical protein KKF65_06305 [Nanoarchaeota archaeon]|nr:hypothetical protein [Nanoarchaeota archaeon]